ncbi:hypothetical protein LXL04_008903 [Taraxacum kok-saghyz]
MAQNKHSGFRFRLPWLLQPALAPPPATATETPRTTVQTSVASTSAPKPPFRPPGRAPPPTIATPRAPPQPASTPVSVESPPSPPPPPPPPIEAKLSVPKSPIAKTIDSVASRSTKEAQTTTGTAQTIKTTGPAPATPPAQRSPSFRPPSPPQPSSPAKVDSQPSSPSRTGTILRESSPPVSPSRADPKPSSPAVARWATQLQPSSPEKQDSKPSSPSRTGTILRESSPPVSPSRADPKPSSPARWATQLQPSSPAKQDSKPSSPSRTDAKFRDSSPPASPSRTPAPPRADSKPPSPSRLATRPYFATKPSSPSSEPKQSRAVSQPTSPVHVQPPPPPPPPAAPTMTTRAVEEAPVNHGAQPSWSTSKPDDTPEIKRSTEITHEKFPVNSYHFDLATDSKTKENSEMKGAQSKSMNPHSNSMEVKSPKPKQKLGTQVPLHREIKDDISKFIYRMATNPPKQSMDEKPASIITLAGDNKGATMHLGPDANKRVGPIDIHRGYKLDAIINGEGSSNGKKSQRDSKASEDQESKAIVNSNIQGVNNSIMFNSSVTERNPGVHLSFSRTLANTDSMMENTEAMEMYKAEVDITPPDTLVYDPTLEMVTGEYEIEVL